MCMVDDSDTLSLFRKSERKARKHHQCGECDRVINPGELYIAYCGIHEGDWFNGKICQHCSVLANWLGVNCGGYICGQVLEDFGEHATEYERMDLARLFVMARNDWQSVRKKTPLPVPASPRDLVAALEQI